jgi:hypothetical protein
MKMMKSLRCAALAAVLMTAGIANAALLQFTVTGGYTATWQMDANPAPDDGEDGLFFTVWDVPGFDDAVTGVADISFFSTDVGGGLEIYDYLGSNVLLSTDGPQLYTGSEDNPFFTLGTFALTEYQGTDTYTLTIAEVGGPVVPPTGVPEPATGALLIGGLALIGVLRKRRSA